MYLCIGIVHFFSDVTTDPSDKLVHAHDKNSGYTPLMQVQPILALLKFSGRLITHCIAPTLPRCMPLCLVYIINTYD